MGSGDALASGRSGADPATPSGGSPIGWSHGEGLGGETPPQHHEPDGVALISAARQAGWLLGSLTGVTLREHARAARAAGRMFDALAERAVGRR